MKRIVFTDLSCEGELVEYPANGEPHLLHLGLLHHRPVHTRVADPELEPALFGSSGAGAVHLLRLRLRTKLKNSLLNCRKYVSM